MSEDIARNILISNISNSLTRIRSIIFVNLALCAVIISNAFLENYSIDKRQIENSLIREDIYKNGELKIAEEIGGLVVGSDKYRNAKLQQSKLRAKIRFIENSLDEHKLRSILVPVIGVSIPANDLNIVCGIFLLFSSVWIVFSINQIKSSLEDERVVEKISESLYALKYSVVFIVPEEKSFLRKLGLSVVAAPFITMLIALLSDMWSSIAEASAINQMQLLSLVVIRLVMLSFISACLGSIALYTIVVWRKLSAKMAE